MSVFIMYRQLLMFKSKYPEEKGLKHIFAKLIILSLIAFKSKYPEEKGLKQELEIRMEFYSSQFKSKYPEEKGLKQFTCRNARGSSFV